MSKRKTIEQLQKMPYEADREVEEWIRTRPPAVQKLMVKFPPDCLVKAKKGKSLMAPSPGKVGIVCSWIESKDGSHKGQVTVVDYDGGFTRGVCEPRWLEVVGYTAGMTPAKIKEIIKG